MIALEQQIIQFAWVVPNLEEAARRWHQTMGIGPFLVNRRLQIAEARYRGQPVVTAFSTAIAQAGPVQIELVEQHDATPSAYRDTVAPGVEGFHHVAIITDRFDDTVKSYTEQGLAIASSGRMGEIRFVYVDTGPALGHMTEILEDSAPLRGFFGAVAKAADRWDRNPDGLLRELG